MHNASMIKMERFVKKYLDEDKELRILDVGSMSMDGTSYRKLFVSSLWLYEGLDLSEGSNVDIVSQYEYDWPVPDNCYDVVISGQCLEHVEDMHKWILEVARVLKNGGFVCIIAPTEWAIHRYPIDCWRILPDGMEFLLREIGGLHIVEVYHLDNDCVGVARKPNNCWNVTFVVEDGDTIRGADGAEYVIRSRAKE